MKKANKKNQVVEVNAAQLESVIGGLHRVDQLRIESLGVIGSPPRPRRPEVRFLSADFGKKNG